MGPFCQLFNGRCSECICCSKNNFLACLFVLSRKFADGCCLADAIDTDDQYHGCLMLKLISFLIDTHLFFDRICQQLLACLWFLDMLFLNLPLQFLNNILRCMNTQICHNKHFFQFFIKIFINIGKSGKDRIKAGHDIISCFCQALHKT